MAKTSTEPKPAPTPDVRVVYYTTQDADGQYYAVRALVPVEAIIETSKRAGPTLGACAEIARRAIEHTSRLMWEAEWSKKVYAQSLRKDAIAHQKLVAGFTSTYPALAERARQLREEVAWLSEEAERHPKEEEVRGLVMYGGKRVRREDIAQHLQAMCEPIETREMLWNRLAAKREILQGLNKQMEEQKLAEKTGDPTARYESQKRELEQAAHHQGQLTAWAAMAEPWR